jgi:hypothetical protein
MLCHSISMLLYPTHDNILSMYNKINLHFYLLFEIDIHNPHSEKPLIIHSRDTPSILKCAVPIFIGTIMAKNASLRHLPLTMKPQ